MARKVIANGSVDGVATAPKTNVPITAVTNGAHVPTWIGPPMRALLDRQKKLERELDALKAKAASGATADLAASAVDVGGVRVLAARIEHLDARALREHGQRRKYEHDVEGWTSGELANRSVDSSSMSS